MREREQAGERITFPIIIMKNQTQNHAIHGDISGNGHGLLKK